MEEHRVFKPTESINNLMGFCRFYRMSPEKSNVLTGPKSAECAREIYGMVEVAKRVGQQLTVVIFDCESVSPMCLLRELHSRVALLRIAIHTPEEVEAGVWNHVYCCSICMYIVKNEVTLLDHIIVGHYWGSFSSGRCLAFTVATAEQMIRHIVNCGQSQIRHHRVRSMHCKVHRGFKSSHKSRKAKKRSKEGVSVAPQKKLCSSPMGSLAKVPSHEKARKQ